MMLLAILVMVALVLQADPDEMGDLLEEMDLTIIAAVVGLYLLNMMAKVLRWYALLSRKEGTPPLRKVGLYFLIGMAVNNSTPGRVSGEPVRAYLVKTGTDYPMGRGMASIFLEKTIDSIVTLSLAVIGLVLLIGVISSEAQSTLFLSIGIVALFMGTIILLLLYPKGMRRLSAWAFRRLRNRMEVERVDRWEAKASGFLGTFETGTREIASNRAPAMAATGLTIVIWLNEALRLWLVFLALGYNISAELMIVAVCLASFAALLIPLGAGASTAIAAICILAGVDPTLSTTAGLVFVMTSIWISLPLGAAAMAISGIRARDVLGMERSKESGGPGSAGDSVRIPPNEKTVRVLEAEGPMRHASQVPGMALGSAPSIRSYRGVAAEAHPRPYGDTGVLNVPDGDGHEDGTDPLLLDEQHEGEQPDQVPGIPLGRGEKK